MWEVSNTATEGGRQRRRWEVQVVTVYLARYTTRAAAAAAAAGRQAYVQRMYWNISKVSYHADLLLDGRHTCRVYWKMSKVKNSASEATRSSIAESNPVS